MKVTADAVGDDSDTDAYLKPEDIITRNVMKDKGIKLEPTRAPPPPVPAVEYSPNGPCEGVSPAAALPVGMNGLGGWSSGGDSDDGAARDEAPGGHGNDPGTPPSPPLHPLSHDPQKRVEEFPYRPLGPHTTARWHPQVQSADRAGTPYPRPAPRTDFAGHEPRAWDPSRRGARQYGLEDVRDRGMITPRLDAFGEPPVHRRVPLPPKKPKSILKKRPRDEDVERKLRVIKRYQFDTDQNPKDILKALKDQGLAKTLPVCCATVASQLMKPHRIEGIKRFTSENSDVLEVIFLPSVRKFATFLSLGFSLEVWKSESLR